MNPLSYLEGHQRVAIVNLRLYPIDHASPIPSPKNAQKSPQDWDET